ncbi:type 1 glutamine amidotransferase domain-containing protein [Methanoculleus sp. 7T]|uniref:type 1 glutamine amidotransferase domain-containing protein n=1 Tax=Methanoculleus sp. 7T TaxID=2937282 RepID=UPI0020C0257E|nr:type 1 glutamine amidotransferase domain-containing protein [Methanoculleus sp. 7T]MCK8518120.1 type 1 glutamine amidotransferase [Methanoculleus sp. 7T]
MSRIAVLITDMFEDVEYTQPAEAFRKAGHELVHVGLSAGETVHGKKEQTPVAIDRSASDVSVDGFDALFIPGGYSPDKLRAHDAPVEFVRQFVKSGKPVLAICHAPQLLITAQVLEGRKITGWKSVAQDIKNAGAEYINREVVVDGNLVSSRKPDDIPAFIEASLEKLRETGGEKAKVAAAEQR